MLLFEGHTHTYTKKVILMVGIVMMASGRRRNSELNFKNNTPCQLAYLCRRFGRVHRVHIQSQAEPFLDCLTLTMIFLGSDHERVCPCRQSQVRPSKCR
jgi:hypothetical protein